MQVDITEKKDNPLLERTDITFRVSHPGEKTPQRSAVREKLATETGAKTAAVIITRMRSRFGQGVTEGTAKVYKSAETAANTEVPYILKRHGLSRDKKKDEGGKPKEAAAEKKPEAPAEKKPQAPAEKKEA